MIHRGQSYSSLLPEPFNPNIGLKDKLTTENLFLFQKTYEPLEVRVSIALGDSSPFSILASSEIR